MDGQLKFNKVLIVKTLIFSRPEEHKSKKRPLKINIYLIVYYMYYVLHTIYYKPVESYRLRVWPIM